MGKDSMMQTRRHELLEDIHTQAASVAQEFGIDKDVADQIGNAIANHMADNWGGQNFTFPKDLMHRLTTRDIEIYEAFDGRNHHILAREYNLSVRRIYKIIKAIRSKGDVNQIQLL